MCIPSGSTRVDMRVSKILRFGRTPQQRRHRPLQPVQLQHGDGVQPGVRHDAAERHGEQHDVAASDVDPQRAVPAVQRDHRLLSKTRRNTKDREGREGRKGRVPRGPPLFFMYPRSPAEAGLPGPPDLATSQRDEASTVSSLETSSDGANGFGTNSKLRALRSRIDSSSSIYPEQTMTRPSGRAAR